MCLKFTSIFQKIPRWALKPKTVYKVMRKRGDDDNLCQSPHRNHTYTLGVEEVATIKTNKNGDVAEGLHAFQNMSDAQDELKKMRYGESRYLYTSEIKLPYEHYIYECTIPKKAKFFIGIWEWYWFSKGKEVPNIVSNRLVINKRLPSEKDLIREAKWNAKKEAKRKAIEDGTYIQPEW